MDVNAKRESEVSKPGLSTKITVFCFLAAVASVAITAYALSTSFGKRTGEIEARIARMEAQIDRIERMEAQINTLTRSQDTTQSEAAVLRGERQELASTPSKYIQSLEITISRRGIINTYSRASSARLKNDSHFNVSDMRGVVEYRRADGSLVGAAPVEITGTLLAGQTATLVLSSGEVTGESSGTSSKVIVQSLTILGGK